MSAGQDIRYQHCRGCGAVAYFRRDFCPRCGAEVDVLVSSGRGVISAITRVERAPSGELQALAPYSLCLVEAEEGFRLMAHADPDLAIGDDVNVKLSEFVGKQAPRASKGRRANSMEPAGE